jgi:large subunit ribosomal protein L3
MNGLIGRKIGMSQVFEEDGTVLPVTVLEMGPCPVVDIKTQERDGYQALQVAFDPVPERKVTKPALGRFKVAGVEPHRTLREFRTEQVAEMGAVFDVTLFEIGDIVDVTGTTKGRGFQGVVKRYNFGGGRKTHGCRTHNVPGSIGCSATPSRVLPGKKLPGHMGNNKKTVRNLRVVRIDKDRNLLIVKGAVPGCRNSLIIVRKIGKKG